MFSCFSSIGQAQEFSTLLQQSQHEGDENMDAICGHPEMKTFCQSGPVTPYATTALLQAQAQAQRKQALGDQMFRPVLQHSGGSGDSNTDRSNTTGTCYYVPDWLW